MPYGSVWIACCLREEIDWYTSTCRIRGLEESPLGIASVIKAISEGHLTPQEGEVICRILAEHAKSIVTQDVNPRLQRLEQLHENEVAIHPE